MAAVLGKNTTPEYIVRRAAHRLGYRFRLHRRDLPGSPDLVFPRYGAVLFVHGCYWHRHTCRAGQSIPSTNTEFWLAKFEANVARDRRVQRALRRQGWRVGVIWQCQTRDRTKLERRIRRFLES